MPKPAVAMLLLLIAPHVVADADVDIDVMPARAMIDASESRIRQLPGLEFAITVRAQCREPAVLRRLSLSVADIRKSWSAEEAGAGIETRVAVPGKQIAPVVTDFCAVEREPEMPLQLIEAALTAQIAVRCAWDDKETIEYRSLPLDVELGCNQPASDELAVPVDDNS